MSSVAKQIKALSSKPIKAVIYTHAHADHTGGIGAFISQHQVDAGNVEVIASAKFIDAFVSENSAIGPLMGQRAMLMYGLTLQASDKKQYVSGCCGHLTSGKTSFIAPSITLPNSQVTRMVAGLELTFLPSGGENAAHMVIYAPQYDTVFIGDELQGPAAPQLHSPRGTKFRDVNAWVAAIDKIRALKPHHMLPGHGKAEYGQQNVANILVTYRDAMQYQHDQAIRLINQGKSPDDLANEIVMPDYLTIDPYTIQTYGNVKTNVRSFYSGYVSWYDGNPTNLDPLPLVTKDQRLVAAMGGRDKVLKLSEDALKSGEIKWSLTLSDKLVRIDNNDTKARYLKAAALRHLGYASINSSNRGFYLGSADQLDGLISSDKIAAIAKHTLFSQGVIAGTSTHALLESLRYKVRPEIIKGGDYGFYFEFSDTKEDFTLNFRHGILAITTGKHPHQLAIKTDRQRFNRLFTQSKPPALATLGEITGDATLTTLFDEAIDLTFHPIRFAVQ